MRHEARSWNGCRELATAQGIACGGAGPPGVIGAPGRRPLDGMRSLPLPGPGRWQHARGGAPTGPLASLADADRQPRRPPPRGNSSRPPCAPGRGPGACPWAAPNGMSRRAAEAEAGPGGPQGAGPQPVGAPRHAGLRRRTPGHPGRLAAHRDRSRRVPPGLSRGRCKAQARCSTGRGEKQAAVLRSALTQRQRPPASAALRLPGAAQAQRCYDFRCQEV